MDGAPLELSLDVLSEDVFEGLLIRTGEFRLGEIQLALAGEIQGLQDPVRSASVTLEGAGLRLGDLLSVLPDSVRGRIPVQAQGLV